MGEGGGARVAFPPLFLVDPGRLARPKSWLRGGGDGFAIRVPTSAVTMGGHLGLETHLGQTCQATLVHGFWRHTSHIEMTRILFKPRITQSR